MGGRKVGRQVELVLVSHNEIDPGLLLEALHSRLGIAPCYGDKSMGRVFQSLSDHISRRPLGIIGHGAGIEHKEVGRLAELDKLKSLAPKSFPKDRGFGLIQPAAERM